MGPKAKRSKSPESQFMFVNEDATTVTRTTKDVELDRIKQSHVQRQNFARKRRLQLQPASSSGPTTTQDSGSASPAAAGPSTATSSPSDAGDDQTYLSLLHSLDLEDLEPEANSDPNLFHHFQDGELSSVSSELLLSAPAFSEDSILDYEVLHLYRPGHFFESPLPARTSSSTVRTVVPRALPPTLIGPPLAQVSADHQILQRWAPPLIQHYNTIILPEEFWAETQKVPMGRMRHAFAIHADMQACMTEPAHMYAFLTTAAIQMYVREGRFLIPGVSSEEGQRAFAVFRTKAIQALRSQIASRRVDYRLAVDIHRLYAASVHLGNYESADQHFHVLLSIVETLGGFNTFELYQLERIVMTDCTAALSRLSIPNLASTWDPGSLSLDMSQRIRALGYANTQAGSAFPPQLRVDDDLGGTIDHLVEILNMSAYLRSTTDYVPEHYRWLSFRTLAIQHSLLYIPLRSELTDQRDCARIALLYWAELQRSPPSALRAAPKSNHVLRQRLSGPLGHSLWRPYTSFLLWVAAIGGITAANDEDAQWYADLARRAADEVCVHGFDALEASMASFLYDSAVQGDLLAQFAARMWPS